MIHGKNCLTTVPVHTKPIVRVSVTILNSLENEARNQGRSRGR